MTYRNKELHMRKTEKEKECDQWVLKRRKRVKEIQSKSIPSQVLKELSEDTFSKKVHVKKINREKEKEIKPTVLSSTHPIIRSL